LLSSACLIHCTDLSINQVPMNHRCAGYTRSVPLSSENTFNQPSYLFSTNLKGYLLILSPERWSKL
jgi:hypothetical protein